MTRRTVLSRTGAWLLAASGGRARASQAGADAAPLARVAIVTDIHYANKESAGTRNYRASLEKLEEALAVWRREGVSLGVELGDLVDASPTAEQETEDLRTVLRKLRSLGVPWHGALGNHCVSTLTKTQFLAEWERDRSFYSFVRNGYRCIVLDSAFTSDGQPYGGREFDWKDAYLPPSQLEWLRSELAMAGEHVLVFVHHRLDGEDHYNVSNAAAVRAVLEASGKVRAVFQGHQHINEHRWIGGIHYCTLKAMVDGAPPENSAYGVLELYPGGDLHLRGYRLLASQPIER